jgi:hypothetical protein
MSTSLTPAEYARRARVYAAAQEDAPERPTIRDQFAMAALGSFPMKTGWSEREWIKQSEEIARQVYAIADAMMKGRAG